MGRDSSQRKGRWRQATTQARDPVIQIDPPDGEARRLWAKVADLAQEFGPDESWCLVGGLMVQLHAYEHDAAPRPTSDIDVLGDARCRPSATEQLSKALDRLGARLAQPPTTDPRIGYRFELEGKIIEILGPDGLKAPPRTLGNYETIEVVGGTQALRRTEKVWISVARGSPVEVRRPTLLAAILLKARALKKVRKKVEDHRQDLILLLSLIHDPRALAEDERLSRSERGWLRAVRQDLNFDDPALHARFSELQRQRARQALDLLTPEQPTRAPGCDDWHPHPRGGCSPARW